MLATSIAMKLMVIYMTMAIILPVAVVKAQASEDYLTLVRDRCSEVKPLLDAQRKRDLVARINRGRAYQNIIDQQNALTLRLRNNEVTADAFERQVTTMRQAFERFRSAYIRYDDAIGNLVGIDCNNQTLQFVEQLVVTRAARAAIGSEVTTIETELGRYREIAVSFQQELQRLNESVLGDQR